MKKLTMLLLVLVIVAGWCWASTSGDPATKLNQPQPGSKLNQPKPGSQLNNPHPGSKVRSARPGHRAVLPGIKTPPIKTALPVSLSEDFEGVTFPPTGWSLAGLASLWFRSTACSGYGVGTASALSDFYNVGSGEEQDLITLTFDPTVAGASLQFDHAYATYITERDSLSIYTSTDGGTTWTLLVGLGGGTDGPLVTAPPTTSVFVPTSSQWATKDFPLPVGTNAAYFRGTSMFGNELYLDNIKVKQPPLHEDFELVAFPPVGWSLAGLAPLWFRSTDCSGYGIGTASAGADFYGVSSGEQDLITLTFEPTTAADTLQFDHAYATFTTERDSLSIYTSTDGGTTWTLLVGLGGGTDGPLVTAPPTTSLFIPTSSQWATKDFPLPVGTNAVYFRGTSMFGNELYLDNIMMKPHAFAHDAAVFAIRSPVSFVTPNTPLAPMVVYKNPGLNTETNFEVGCFVDSSGSIVYQDSSLVASLAPGDTDAVSFSNWTPGPAGTNYTFKAWCRLTGDLNSANDTLARTTTSFALLTTLMAPRGTAPTIDGVINTSEWADANKYDVSDVFGNGGSDPGGVPPGTAFLYLKNDSNNLYVAVDNNFGASADYDQLGLYFDDNHDHAWAADSSEGNFWWVYVGTGNRIIYRYIPEYNTTEPVPGMTVAVSTSSGHQQYEGLVQIGEKPPNPNWWLNADIGDTVGFYMYSQFNGVVQRGWWPQAMPNIAWNDPTQYGHLVLGEGPSGVEIQQPVKGQLVAALYPSRPNPVRGNATITYSIPNGTDVSLKVYDAMGRLVRTLASGTRDAGIHNVSLDASRLASGVYFYRIQAGGFSATRKLVVAR